MSGRLARVAVAGLLLLLAAGPALAQSQIRRPGDPPPQLPGLGSNDPRMTVPVNEPPWNSIGRLQTETGGRCTGTLIAPDTVLTAAHCLFAPGGGFVQPRSVHFLLGYERARATARRRAVSFRTGLPPQAGQQRMEPNQDWALITLDEPIQGPTLPLLTRPIEPRTPLMLPGYQQDRPEVMLADTGCRLLEHRAGTLLHDCAGTRGSSGGPVLVRTGRGWAVAGVASRAAHRMAIGQAVGVEMLPTAGRR
ncbi:MAG: trypsin-like peptidase domain-containing protein [Rubritepida sp.]|jgi:protease YdgD|nr:trypsin-like peptidase domain-containing protein [Rubritepida sp.]